MASVISPMKSSLRIRTSSETKREDVEMEGIDGETDKKKVSAYSATSACPTLPFYVTFKKNS